jgi:hypothetical protein
MAAKGSKRVTPGKGKPAPSDVERRAAAAEVVAGLGGPNAVARGGGRALDAGSSERKPAPPAGFQKGASLRASIYGRLGGKPVEGQAEALGEFLREVDREVVRAIDGMREQGASWAALRPVFRVGSAQAVQQRVARLRSSLED